MTMDTVSHPGPPDPVHQFSVFVANKLGRLHELNRLLGQNGVHILGMTVLDTTDSAILRLVADDPDRARELLRTHGFAFTETRIVVVEVDVEGRLEAALAALFEAEINIHSLYALFVVPGGRPLLALSVEDREVAVEALRRHQLRVLDQADLSR